MNWKVIICSLISLTLLLTGCSQKSTLESNANESKHTENKGQKKDELKQNDNVTNIINKYFKSMEEHNLDTIGSLFIEGKNDLSETLDIDYIKSTEVDNIEEVNYEDDSISVYLNYIQEEYGKDKEDIKIFKVNFTIEVNDGYDKDLGGDFTQKFALVRDKETSKWLICEMFR